MLYLWDFEEERGGNGAGFKVIIWGAVFMGKLTLLDTKEMEKCIQRERDREREREEDETVGWKGKSLSDEPAVG